VTEAAAPGALLHETHVSVVVEVGERVYKLKKPVRMDFLDFRSREAREAVCHREVELNRRLAPDVYLGVADVHGPDGEVCDHLVVMRRLPASRRLAALVRAGDDVDSALHALAHLLATFHARAETSPEIAAAGRRDALRARWESGFATLDGFSGSVLEPDRLARLRALVGEYLEGRDALFEQRIRDGKVRDGHGDLQCEDIFLLDDGPRVLDCIEFDDHLRHGDVLDDLAFLAMDLERLGAPDAAARFLGWYRELAGETYPESLAHHYVAYRAQVRSKVACLRTAQGDAEATEQARALLDLALDHAARGRVVLVLVGGPPGTGKSTLAAGISRALGHVLLRSDEIRKDLLGTGHTTGVGGAFATGGYGPDTTARTYGVLLERAATLLGAGESVVLDASWTDALRRDEARAVAAAAGVPLVELRCDVALDVAAARVAGRGRRGRDASDATVEVAEEMARRADPWPSALVVDTSGTPRATVEDALRQVGDALRRRGPAAR
jgi:aminoglycoside phosphotransferase family enzyme/predicted kinase